MSVDATSLVIPGHGTAFTAPVGTKPPTNPMETFTLQGTSPASWENLGHTSKQNLISFTKEGGEKETLDTFLTDGVRTSTASVQWGVNIAALQMDKATLDLAFDGAIDAATGGYTVAASSTVQRALFLYFQDNTASLGFWMPNVEISLGDAPSVDTAQFFELPLTATILAGDASVIPTVKGKAGIFQIFRPGLVAGGGSGE